MTEILINNDKRSYSEFFKNSQISKNVIKTYNYNGDYKLSYRDEIFETFKKAILCLVLTVVVISFFDGLVAGVSDNLRQPMVTMKKEVWSYLMPVKIASVVVGGAFSLMKQSLMPFGVGAGITACIQFFDSIIGDGSAFLI